MDPLPPDPYLALGVPKDASSTAIKSAYRKLVLTCHPDKVQDESLKEKKREEFHKIQSAWELIGDEANRSKYDAQARLEKLRAEKLARSSGPDLEVKNAGYKVRTEAPRAAAHPSATAFRYEERKPARSYDDDRYYEDRSSSRKHSSYESYPKHSSSSRTTRVEREPIRVAKPADRTRSERTKTRDRTERSERSGKYSHVDDDSSSDDERMQTEYKRRSEDDRRRKEEEARKEAAYPRKKSDERRSYDEPKQARRHGEDSYDRQRKTNDLVGDAIKHMYRTSAEPEARPSPSRTNSSRDIPKERVDSYSKRPETVRRSSAAPRKDRPQASGRERSRYEIVDWEDDRSSREPPPFSHSKSSPAEIRIPHPGLERAYTDAPRERRRETSPPSYRRADTMPNAAPSSSSRRKDATVTRPSGLRASESAPPREVDEFPTIPPSRTSTKYYSYSPGGGVTLQPEQVNVMTPGGHRTVVAEPSRRRNRSPSPLDRPPIGKNRVPEKTSSQSRSASSFVPSLGRSATYTEHQDRGRLYREVNPDSIKRESARRANYSPDNVSFARRAGPEDISWAGGRDRPRDECEHSSGYELSSEHERHRERSKRPKTRIRIERGGGYAFVRRH